MPLLEISRRARAAFAVVSAAAVWFGSVLPAVASQSWPGIRAELYGDRVLHDGSPFITLRAPDRPDDQLRVPVGIEVQFRDGRTINSITLIIDENPTPIAAQFNFGPNRPKVGVASTFRFDAVTGVRAIVEASDGELYMSERHVRFTGGQSACAAPPNGSPEEIAAKMGQMQLGELTPRATHSNELSRVRLDVSHPNHTGMVKDQMTLLYIQLMLLDKISVMQGSDKVVDIKGSMSFSQDPTFEFDFLTNGAEELSIDAKDTDGREWHKEFPLGPGS
jgi:sulfur-oxidizing protein SoxY